MLSAQDFETVVATLVKFGEQVPRTASDRREWHVLRSQVRALIAVLQQVVPAEAFADDMAKDLALTDLLGDQPQ